MKHRRPRPIIPRRTRRQRRPLPESPLAYASDPTAVCGGNRVRLFHSGPDFFRNQLDAIAAAKRFVHAEMYIFASDRTGWTMAEALAAAARRGVRVRVLYDGIGSWDTDVALFDHLDRHGVELAEYHPVRFRLPRAAWNDRNHRKVVVIDGTVAWCGGANWANEYVRPIDAGGWRDAAARVEGPLVEGFNAVFSHTWREVHDGRCPSSDGLAPENSPIPWVPAQGDCTAHGPVLARGIWTGENLPRRSLVREYHHVARVAARYVWIANAYFVPGARLRRRLAGAVRAGVDVRVMVPASPDVAVIYWATRRYFRWMLRQGIRIYEWQGAMLHAKTAVADDAWCIVGSSNLDPRSRFRNAEADLVVYDRDAARNVRAALEADLETCREVELSEWERRPWWHRILERAVYSVRWLL